MKKKLLAVFMTAALSLSCFSAVPIVSQAAEYTSGDFTYSLDYSYSFEGASIIAGYTGSDPNVVIPSEIDGHTVISIGDSAFKQNTNITSVVIPDTVQTIGTSAFFRCPNLSNVHLGNSVRSLSAYCFKDCDSLTSINIPASMTASNAYVCYPFNECDALKTATIESGGVKIPDELFSECRALQNVNIPEGIQEIGGGSFFCCVSLEEIKIPDSVQTISGSAFLDCKNLKEVILPENIRKIGNGAFGGCRSLKEITLPESIKVVEAGAFSECTSLKDLYDYSMGAKYPDKPFYDTPLLTIHGFEGSNAQKYANSNNITFVPIPSTKKSMYRLYNENSGEHFYTSNAEEKNNLVSVGWTYEGTAWTAPVSSNTPVYRVYNPNSGEHHYTMDANEKSTLVSLGWNDEGIGWYSDDNKGVPLYRLYNPNATGQYEAGGHHYTKDVNEKNTLIAAGWRDEGIGWYGIEGKEEPTDPEKKPLEIGDTVVLGTYEQDLNYYNGADEIEWVVLAKEGDKALVISKFALACQQYNSSDTDVTWETCSLRQWLNEKFISSAFSSDEQKMIQTTTITADQNPTYGTPAGNNTNDKVFLLSITEANKYFSSDEARLCAPTVGAKLMGASYTGDSYSEGGEDTCWWWLRSPGNGSNAAVRVSSSGIINTDGCPVNNKYSGVRPAMWIKL